MRNQKREHSRIFFHYLGLVWIAEKFLRTKEFRANKGSLEWLCGNSSDASFSIDFLTTLDKTLSKAAREFPNSYKTPDYSIFEKVYEKVSILNSLPLFRWNFRATLRPAIEDLNWPQGSILMKYSKPQMTCIFNADCLTRSHCRLRLMPNDLWKVALKVKRTNVLSGCSRFRLSNKLINLVGN